MLSSVSLEKQVRGSIDVRRYFGGWSGQADLGYRNRLVDKYSENAGLILPDGQREEGKKKRTTRNRQCTGNSEKEGNGVLSMVICWERKEEGKEKAILH